jgi:hypothetical protein
MSPWRVSITVLVSPEAKCTGVALFVALVALLATTAARAGQLPAPLGFPYPGATWENGRAGAAALITPPAPSPGVGVGWADGSSNHPAISQDNRDARLLAFDSQASNLVPRDLNGLEDVFVFRRTPGAGQLTGSLERVSVADRGPAEANGPSQRPSLDGSTWAAPHCAAFESRATNLTADDREPDWDVYVRDLAKGQTALLSRGLTDARAPVIDGSCRQVAFSARGAVYIARIAPRRMWRLARGGDVDQQTNGLGAAYVRGGQIYYRPFAISGGRFTPGREILISDSGRGQAGNGASADPALDDSGHYVAFDSRATNLCLNRCRGVSRDANGRRRDVFRRTLAHAPTADSMQMVSLSLPSGLQGNGDSWGPSMSGAGENVVFTSRATNFAPGLLPAPMWIPESRAWSWQLPRGRGYGHVTLIHRRGCTQGCPGPADQPVLSSRGNYVAWRTRMSEFCLGGWQPFAGDRPCPTSTDVFERYVGPSHEGRPLG